MQRKKACAIGMIRENEEYTLKETVLALLVKRNNCSRSSINNRLE